MKIVFMIFCIIMIVMCLANFALALKYCEAYQKVYIGLLSFASELILFIALFVMITKF